MARMATGQLLILCVLALFAALAIGQRLQLHCDLPSNFKNKYPLVRGFTVINGDCEGNAIMQPGNVNMSYVNSARQCAERCLEYENCVGFSYGKGGHFLDPKRIPRCAIKYAACSPSGENLRCRDTYEHVYKDAFIYYHKATPIGGLKRCLEVCPS